ncbi:HSF-type DNA-binding-domain-containing protein [Phascolomyces articulosus]|uniref:HSF-type DNA-binding-domain-containing protein n=1 Tax=Phascolomyces articulosus TaxID=60185 RepID=A0AAD5PHD5_9FUNG|nr:HSF-type DNA-binding-domain-containing protein [Phascolomyces articulosus]
MSAPSYSMEHQEPVLFTSTTPPQPPQQQPAPAPPSQQKPSNANTFVHKLYNMVIDNQYQHLIAWTYTGSSFIVCNIMEFSRDVLPKHFKHNNFSSFVRQLNMYGFHKVNKSPRGHRTLAENQIWEFSHPRFLRNRHDLLDDIKRKAIEADTSRGRDNRDLHSHMTMMQVTHSDMMQRINHLFENFNELVKELAETKQKQASQEELMKNMLQFISQQNGGHIPPELNYQQQQQQPHHHHHHHHDPHHSIDKSLTSISASTSPSMPPTTSSSTTNTPTPSIFITSPDHPLDTTNASSSHAIHAAAAATGQMFVQSSSPSRSPLTVQTQNLSPYTHHQRHPSTSSLSSPISPLALSPFGMSSPSPMVSDDDSSLYSPHSPNTPRSQASTSMLVVDQPITPRPSGSISSSSSSGAGVVTSDGTDANNPYTFVINPLDSLSHHR